jgi:ABC-type polar amino acid transport system ATPase subunit
VGRHLPEAQAVHRLTVLENVMVGAFQKTRPRERRSRRAALDSVGLGGKEDAHARVLSTGQAQAPPSWLRALATKPRLLLLDVGHAAWDVDPGSIPGLVELVRGAHAEGMALPGHRAQHARDHGQSRSASSALHLGEVIGDGPPRRWRATTV